ncbi:rhs element Vgr protein, partial [Escherichia coli FDA504]
SASFATAHKSALLPW